MKLIALIFFAFSLSASAETIQCSNAEGTLRYDYWTYEGGAPPPPDMPIRVVKWFVNGVEHGESEGRFIGRERLISRTETKCDGKRLYLVKGIVEPQDVLSTSDTLICRNLYSKCPRP